MHSISRYRSETVYACERASRFTFANAGNSTMPATVATFTIASSGSRNPSVYTPRALAPRTFPTNR